MFDEVVESCRVGLRKPDPEIYKHVLGKLNMAAGDVVFLDDIGSNLAAAKSVGIDTIKVVKLQSIVYWDVSKKGV